MRARHVALYILYQFLMLNLCVLLGSTLYHVLPPYVNTIVLILILPVALSFVLGHRVGSRFGDSERQHNFTAANGLVGILVAIAVGVIMRGGGIGIVRSLTLKRLTGVRPEEAAQHGGVDYLELADARILTECAHQRVIKSSTTHRSHDGRSRRLSHSEAYGVAPVVGPDYRDGDPIGVWLVNYSMVSRSARGWSAETSRGGRGKAAESEPISGVVILEHDRRASYVKTAREAIKLHGLKEAPRVYYIEYTPDFDAYRRRRARTALIMLAAANVLLVLLPALIYRVAFRPKEKGKQGA